MSDQQIEWNRVNVIAFDLFGTVFDMSQTPQDEIKAYADHIRKPEWTPLRLPTTWQSMPAFSDSRDGVARLREDFYVVTCSNAPLGLQISLCKNADIQFDGMIPLELNRVFKTNPKAYLTICEVMDIDPSRILMVTANKTFGDLEASSALGMQSVLIRGESRFSTIRDLAKEACG
jgi:HAD superfamily hydrolase (TIGR01493 family)